MVQRGREHHTRRVLVPVGGAVVAAGVAVAAVAAAGVTAGAPAASLRTASPSASVTAARSEAHAAGPTRQVAKTNGIRQVAKVTLPAGLAPLAALGGSTVDPATHLYYLADQTNNGVDVVGTTSNAFAGILAKGAFVGATPTLTATQQAACPGDAGPNALALVTVGGSRQLWASDGVSSTQAAGSVKVISLKGSTGTVAATVSTGAACAAGALAYDPTDHLVAVVSPEDSPASVTFVSAQANPALDKVVAVLKVPQALGGLGGPGSIVYDPAGKRFLVSVPHLALASGAWKGEVLVVNPRTAKAVAAYPVNGCSPSGLALNGTAHLLAVGCSDAAMHGGTIGGVTYHQNPAETLVLDSRTGRVHQVTYAVGGTTEVAYSARTGGFYTASAAMTSNSWLNGYPTPALGVFSASTGDFVESFSTLAGSRSVAADPSSIKLFVPIAGYGIAVMEPSP